MWLRLAGEGLPTKSLTVSFDNMWRDYVIYYPGSQDKYIVLIAGVPFGFGPRYMLNKHLKTVKGSYPVTIPQDVIQVEKIPQLSQPVHRLLGKKQKYLRIPESEREAIIDQTFSPSDKDEHVTGYEDSIRRINEREKIKITNV